MNIYRSILTNDSVWIDDIYKHQTRFLRLNTSPKKKGNSTQIHIQHKHRNRTLVFFLGFVQEKYTNKIPMAFKIRSESI